MANGPYTSAKFIRAVVEVAPGALGPRDGGITVDLVEPGCDPATLPWTDIARREVILLRNWHMQSPRKGYLGDCDFGSCRLVVGGHRIGAGRGRITRLRVNVWPANQHASSSETNDLRQWATHGGIISPFGQLMKSGVAVEKLTFRP
jgi:hypothetical protein